MEEWRPIPGFADYDASDLGRVRRRKTGRALKTQRGPYYEHLTLYINREPFTVTVHRVVCLAFHGEPPTPKHHAAHGNGDGFCNRKDNLRWALPVENEADKIAHGRSRRGKPSAVPLERRARGATHGRSTKPECTARGERTGTSKLTEAAVRAIRSDTRPRKVIAADYSVTVTLVGYVQRKLIWRHVT